MSYHMGPREERRSIDESAEVEEVKPQPLWAR